MSDQSSLLQQVGQHFGIEVVSPAKISLGKEHPTFTALLTQFGGEKGIVVDPEWATIEPFVEALKHAGFGFSCITIDDDITGLGVVLMDWAWTSDQPRPSRLQDD